MKKVTIYLKRTIWALISLILVYLIFAVILSLLSTKIKTINCEKTESIYISSNGIHLDLIIPQKNLNRSFIQKIQIIDSAKYISFGWGDKQFYINTPNWSDLTFSIAFKALFLKSETAMHVSIYKTSYVQWKKIDLCKIQLENLNSFIENTFQKSKKNKFIKIDIPGYSKNDYFFEAQGSFSFYRTCNVWVNEALKEANIKTSLWSPFVYGVLYHIDD